jgi:hypothetical protein
MTVWALGVGDIEHRRQHPAGADGAELGRQQQMAQAAGLESLLRVNGVTLSIGLGWRQLAVEGQALDPAAFLVDRN